MDIRSKRAASWALAGMLLSAVRALALTSNGNDFALYFSEAKTDAERATLLKNAVGQPHFFRYLQIRSMEEGEKDGRPYVAIESIEPSSLMRIKFLVTKQVSLQKLREDPDSKPGDAIALNGVLNEADPRDNVITLDQVIIRHKDRLAPKIGKELLGEVNPDAVYYSYTAGKRPVMVTFRDRDLLARKGEILGKEGPQAWANYLEKELAERKKARSAK